MALRSALTQLAEQDPLINVRDLAVSLYGEVQKEVIQATLADDFGIEVRFQETTPLYIERPTGTGEAVEILNAPDNPFRATIGLRVERAPADSGVTVRVEVDFRTVPLFVYRSLDGLHREHGPVRAAHPGRGPARLAGPRLRRDALPQRIQLAGRATGHPRPAQHGRRLPQAHAAGADAGPGTRRRDGLRADDPGARRRPGGCLSAPCSARSASSAPSRRSVRTATTTSPSRRCCPRPPSAICTGAAQPHQRRGHVGRPHWPAIDRSAVIRRHDRERWRIR